MPMPMTVGAAMPSAMPAMASAGNGALGGAGGSFAAEAAVGDTLGFATGGWCGGDAGGGSDACRSCLGLRTGRAGEALPQRRSGNGGNLTFCPHRLPLFCLP